MPTDCIGQVSLPADWQQTVYTGSHAAASMRLQGMARQQVHIPCGARSCPLLCAGERFHLPSTVLYICCPLWLPGRCLTSLKHQNLWLTCVALLQMVPRGWWKMGLLADIKYYAPFGIGKPKASAA